MKSSHLTLMLLGLMTQAVGWTFLPRRWRTISALLAVVLDATWMVWYAFDNRSLSVSGVWSLSPVATWLSLHLIMGPVVGVEVTARVLPWRRGVRLVGLILILGGYGWGLGEAYGPPVVTEVTLRFSDLPPAFDGYKIVLFGDIHAGPYAGKRTVGRWAKAIGQLHGDLLLGAGDFVSGTVEEANRTIEAFKSIHPRDGLVGVPGNHDQYPQTEAVAERLRSHGWMILQDQILTIERQNQRIVILGSKFPMDNQKSTKPEWRGKPWPSGFRIGLCHDPLQWSFHLQEGARLTLAAHTHGGQVNLSPFYNAALERSPYVAGLYQKGPDALFVTRGLGCTGLPFRFRCRPEIVRITLHRNS